MQMEEKAREMNVKNREQKTGKLLKIFCPCKFTGKPCKNLPDFKDKLLSHAKDE